jgi:hypothetical protein
MIEAAVYEMRVNRHTPFKWVLEYAGADWSTATVLMQVRQLPEQSGTALLELNSGSEFTLAYSSGVTTFTLLIPEADIEALPAAAETGQDLTLYYDVQITPPGGIKEVYVRGKFTVIAGVTF